MRLSRCKNIDNDTISGGNGEGVPPVPIPNTEVKPFSADGTWLETARESRSLPDPKKNKAPQKWGLVLFGLGNDLSPEASPAKSDIVLGWDRSLPPPVAEAGRRSVGNRKERLRDYASSPGAHRQTRTPGSAHCKAPRLPVGSPLTGRLPTKANARERLAQRCLLASWLIADHASSPGAY